MAETRIQPLSARFANIISMMLGMIRAQGLRSLLHLPELWAAARELRRFGEAIVALLKAFEAGTLPPPAPAPSIAPQECQLAPAQPAATPRPAARPAPAARDRQRPAMLPSPPAADAAPDRPRAADGAYPAPPRPPHRTPHALAVLRLPTGIIATGRCS